MKFGFYSASFSIFNVPATSISAIDNWSVTINRTPLAYDPNFTLSATLPAGSSTYQLKATYPAPPFGTNVWWRVEAIDLVTDLAIPGTVLIDSTNWVNSPYDIMNNFSGYDGTPFFNNDNFINLIPGIFLQGHRYRITRGLSGNGCGLAHSLKTVFMCDSC
jgi:hypothetical protein